jgi:hypothetical protein
MATGLDLDGDGRLGGAADAQGFGEFTGQGGMAILSRHPIGPVTDHSAFLWRDLPGQIMPELPPEDVRCAAAVLDRRIGTRRSRSRAKAAASAGHGGDAAGL